MYKNLLKYGVCSLFIFLLKTDCAAAKPFRYVGVGAGVNIHGNSSGSDTDMRTDNLNVQGTLRVQLPISKNASVSSNFLYANDDPNLLFSANLHLNPMGSVQPRIGVGVNIVLHNAPHMDGGILGHKTSPILNLGLDVKLSKQWVFFGDAYYAIAGNDDNDGTSDSLALVSGVGIRF
jgi:hypothetical protein